MNLFKNETIGGQIRSSSSIAPSSKQSVASRRKSSASHCNTSSLLLGLAVPARTRRSGTISCGCWGRPVGRLGRPPERLTSLMGVRPSNLCAEKPSRSPVSVLGGSDDRQNTAFGGGAGTEFHFLSLSSEAGQTRQIAPIRTNKRSYLAKWRLSKVVFQHCCRPFPGSIAPATGIFNALAAVAPVFPRMLRRGYIP